MSHDVNASLPAPRIAFFLGNLDGGGAERDTINLAEGFGQRGWNVDLLLIHAAGPYLDLPQTRSEGIRFVELRPRHQNRKKGLAKWWEYALCAGPLVRYLEQTPCVLISIGDVPNVLALIVKRFRRHDFRLIVKNAVHLSAIAQLKGWRTRQLVTMIRRLLPAADAIVANSQGSAEDLRWHTPKAAPRVMVIYNAVVAPGLVEQAAEPVAHPWFEGSSLPVILAVGRLVSQKDYPTLLKAFAAVVHSRPARLVVLGEGPLRRDLEALAARLGLAASVDLPGFQLNPFAWMAKAQMLALSSRAEGSPNVLIQAMACGTPVVSTDCPSGPREILADGTFGPLVPVGDSPALAQAIMETMDNPPPVDRLIARANEYSVKSSVEQYLELVTRLTERRSPNAGRASRNEAP